MKDARVFPRGHLKPMSFPLSRSDFNLIRRRWLVAFVAAVLCLPTFVHAQYRPTTVQSLDNEGQWNRESSNPFNLAPLQSPGAFGFGESFIAPDLARGLLFISFTAKSSIPG